MTENIRNIYCVGRNYGKHAAELGNAVPETPMIFMKPSHAAIPMEGGALALPSGFGSVHYEAEMVVRIGRSYEPGIALEELLADFALGLDLTLRDVQSELKEKQQPWLKSKGFFGSAPLTAFRPLPALETLTSTEFSLNINRRERQRGRLADAIFDLSVLTAHIGGHYGLAAGDLIFTGTPDGVGELHDGDSLELFWADTPDGSGTVTLK
ncbi:fumarylacetoacetate hydrolase family protein [Paenibacillus sp. S150]|uniref:fumarylacetoacetate hydrolase family protein n=1 Tax=Paenibacillus sp. S150 TaxID=2749826 RepID=UPI001C56F378|nr:fumarylacetoacetate hydrolase family protein [Paenibacillus sp. S150]MBW4081994.1 fumarylacetoacetate hydrolase family protein [Paenibacillus sp. S150]